MNLIRYTAEVKLVPNMLLLFFFFVFLNSTYSGKKNFTEKLGQSDKRVKFDGNLKNTKIYKLFLTKLLSLLFS